MQINLSGHHIDLTDGIRNAVDEKFAKVEAHYPYLDSLDVLVTVEKHEQKVEAKTQYMGAPVAVNASQEDLYSAIADAAKKLEAALAHRKGVRKAHLHDKPVITDPE